MRTEKFNDSHPEKEPDVTLDEIIELARDIKRKDEDGTFKKANNPEFEKVQAQEELSVLTRKFVTASDNKTEAAKQVDDALKDIIGPSWTKAVFFDELLLMDVRKKQLIDEVYSSKQLPKWKESKLKFNISEGLLETFWTPDNEKRIFGKVLDRDDLREYYEQGCVTKEILRRYFESMGLDGVTEEQLEEMVKPENCDKDFWIKRDSAKGGFAE